MINWKDRREEFWDKKCNLKMHASMFKMSKHYVEKMETINKEELETVDKTVNENDMDTNNDALIENQMETSPEVINENEQHDPNIVNEQNDNIEVIMNVNENF